MRSDIESSKSLQLDGQKLLYQAYKLSTADITSFVFGRKKNGYIHISKDDLLSPTRGHFCSGDVYIFLILYTDKNESESENHEIKYTLKPKIILWQGLNSSQLAIPHFKLLAESEMSRIVRESCGYDTKIKTIIQNQVLITTQGKEPPELIASTVGLPNQLIIHQQSREFIKERILRVSNFINSSIKSIGNELDCSSNPPILYHINTDRAHSTTRAVEIINASAHSLISRDIFFIFALGSSVEKNLKKKDCGILWIGKGASSDEIKNSHSVTPY